MFRKRAKIGKAQARARALRLYPGTPQSIEYEIETNGNPTFELDIVDAESHQYKIEISAITGEIIEVHVEDWEIGMEPEEEVGSGE